MLLVSRNVMRYVMKLESGKSRRQEPDVGLTNLDLLAFSVNARSVTDFPLCHLSRGSLYPRSV